MKKFILFALVTFFCANLFAEKVYRSDGTFFELTRNGKIFASKIDEVSLKAPENYTLKWRSGSEFIVIDNDNKGNLPVYLSGLNIVIADSSIFYRGTKSAEFIEKKYGVKVKELWNDYNLIEFDGAADSVKTAQAIVENGDGFAFPNLHRRSELKSVNPVKFPINDKYYKAGYQWSLKNTGKGIGYEAQGNGYKVTEMDILKHADVKFEEAMQFIHDQIEAGELDGFDANTKVAIMDSGVDFDHPDLKNKLEHGYNMVHEGESGNPGKVSNNGMYGPDGYSHGTNCAGVAAAEGNDIGTVGICPWCGIYPVTYMEGGIGTQESTSDAKLLAVYTEYANDPEIVAINCSFGPSAAMGYVEASPGEIESHKKFMEEGRNGLGGVIVYASGNDGIDAEYTGILSYEFDLQRGDQKVKSKVVTVGASSAWDTRVTYSNYGDMLDIVAPSLSMQPLIGIATSYLTGYGDLDSDYTNQFSGTSSATPVITGAFGVIFSVNPELTLEEAVDILHRSADKVNPETGFYDEDGHSVKYGYGRLNLLKAARLAAGLDMCEKTTKETADNLDNNCDGKVDEGLAKDISKVAKSCKADADCETADFKGDEVACLSGDYNKYNFKNGYCTIKNDNYTCPDGTAPLGDYDSDCLLECNDGHPCPKGFACSDEKLGLCFPECKEDSDCNESRAHCDTKTKLCKNNPSEPLGPCESDSDCKYKRPMCMTEMPDGLCLIMCKNDYSCNDDDDGPNKCAEVKFGQYEMQICLPHCEDDSECRDLGYMKTKCHKLYNGKENICGTACKSDEDCRDPEDEAKCVKSRCVSVNEPDETDTEEDDEENDEDNDTADEGDSGASEEGDTASDEEPAVSDEDSDEDMTYSDDDNKTKKKKSSGCAVTTL